MSGHLGDRVAALVDGQLDHRARERALSHLAHCPPCRAETDAHRRLKASLGVLRDPPPQPSPELTARLMAVATERAQPPSSPRPTPRPPRRPLGAGRPRSRSGAALRPRRAAAAGALLAVGLAGAIALGGPASSGPAPVDPASPAFVEAYVDLTSEVPLTEPAAATLVPAGLAGPGR